MSRRLSYSGLAALTIAATLLGAMGGGAVQTNARTLSVRTLKVTKIGIATPEKAQDYGWNQQGVLAARAVAGAMGAQLIVDDGIGYDNVESVLSRIATQGANFIIAQASGYDAVAPRVAERYHVPIVTYDAPNDLVKGYVSDIETSSQQGSYLAGVLAAKTTKTGTLGIVISASDINWFKMAGGFIAGARSVSKHVKFLLAQIGQASYDDAAGGKRVAQSVISGGADVVFGMGDGASFGYLQAAETASVGHKVWFIDVIGNKSPIDTHHVLLTSVVWDFTSVFKQAIRDINNGTYGTRVYYLDASDGVSLLKTPYISASVYSLIEQDRLAIVSGKIKVPLAATEAAVRQMMK